MSRKASHRLKQLLSMFYQSPIAVFLIRDVIDEQHIIVKVL